MQSLVQYRKKQLQNELYKITVKEALNRHFDILRMEMINAIKLPSILSEGNFVAKSAYQKACKEDFEDNKTIIEFIIQSYKDNLYKHILAETASTKVKTVDDLKNDLDKEIDALILNLRTDIENVLVASRPLTGDEEEKAATGITSPLTGSLSPSKSTSTSSGAPSSGTSSGAPSSGTSSGAPSSGSSSGAPSSGSSSGAPSSSSSSGAPSSSSSSGAPSSSSSSGAPSSGSSSGASSSSGSSGASYPSAHIGASHSPGSTFTTSTSSHGGHYVAPSYTGTSHGTSYGTTRPPITRGGVNYTPSPYGYLKPHDKWWKGVKRAIYDPIAGWVSKKTRNFRRRWHDDPMREHSMFLETVFLESFLNIEPIIADFKDSIKKLIKNRVDDILKLSSIPLSTIVSDEKDLISPSLSDSEIEAKISKQTLQQRLSYARDLADKLLGVKIDTKAKSKSDLQPNHIKIDDKEGDTWENVCKNLRDKIIGKLIEQGYKIKSPQYTQLGRILGLSSTTGKDNFIGTIFAYNKLINTKNSTSDKVGDEETENGNLSPSSEQDKMPVTPRGEQRADSITNTQKIYNDINGDALVEKIKQDEAFAQFDPEVLSSIGTHFKDALNHEITKSNIKSADDESITKLIQSVINEINQRLKDNKLSIEDYVNFALEKVNEKKNNKLNANLDTNKEKEVIQQSVSPTDQLNGEKESDLEKNVELPTDETDVEDKWSILDNTLWNFISPTIPDNNTSGDKNKRLDKINSKVLEIRKPFDEMIKKGENPDEVYALYKKKVEEITNKEATDVNSGLQQIIDIYKSIGYEEGYIEEFENLIKNTLEKITGDDDKLQIINILKKAALKHKDDYILIEDKPISSVGTQENKQLEFDKLFDAHGEEIRNFLDFASRNKDFSSKDFKNKADSLVNKTEINLRKVLDNETKIKNIIQKLKVAAKIKANDDIVNGEIDNLLNDAISKQITNPSNNWINELVGEFNKKIKEYNDKPETETKKNSETEIDATSKTYVNPETGEITEAGEKKFDEIMTKFLEYDPKEGELETYVEILEKYKNLGDKFKIEVLSEFGNKNFNREEFLNFCLKLFDKFGIKGDKNTKELESKKEIEDKPKNDGNKIDTTMLNSYRQMWRDENKTLIDRLKSWYGMLSGKDSEKYPEGNYNTLVSYIINSLIKEYWENNYLNKDKTNFAEDLLKYVSDNFPKTANEYNNKLEEKGYKDQLTKRSKKLSKTLSTEKLPENLPTESFYEKLRNFKQLLKS